MDSQAGDCAEDEGMGCAEEGAQQPAAPADTSEQAKVDVGTEGASAEPVKQSVDAIEEIKKFVREKWFPKASEEILSFVETMVTRSKKDAPFGGTDTSAFANTEIDDDSSDDDLDLEE